MMSRKFWNSEKLLSLAAILISVCTLIVFLYQTNLIRKQQYMSVFPYLELNHNGIETDQYKFVLKNKGIGPALITNIKIKKDGKHQEGNFVQYISRIKTEKDSLRFYYSTLFEGRLISAGEEIEVVADIGKNFKSSQKLYDILNDKDFTWTLDYESIYGEKWQIRKGGFKPKKIE